MENETKGKNAQLHGKVPMENKADVSQSADYSGDMGKAVREKEVLTYLKAGEVDAGLAAFKKENPDLIDLEESGDIYP